MTETVNHSTSLTIRKHRIREAYDETINWIYDKKSEIERCKYGRNRHSLEQGLQEQEAQAQQIRNYRADIDKALSRTFDKEKQANLEKAYDELKEVSDRKLKCLTTMLDITSLEEHCSRLSREMDMTSVGLVNPGDREKTGQDGGNIQGFISPSSQDCVFGVQDNWNWIVKLVCCIDTHLKNGSNYHQFFHEIDESAPWMLQDLEKIQKSFEITPLTGDYSDAQRLMKELEDVAVSLKQWETKTDHLWEKANKVVPVHLRTEGVKQATPARALCDYTTKEVSIREGEDILLLDNSQPNVWRIRTCRGDEGDVPALAVLIPGPYKDAVDAAVKLRLQLLTQWTNAIKRLGKRLLCFMLLVFKPDYGNDEIQAIRSIKRLDKQELLRILDHVEDTLRTHWSDHEGFINLQERILALRMILEEVGDETLQDDGLMSALVVQITSLEKLMNQYKGIYGNWEMYKTSVEASQNPDLMLIVDKWQQLQFVTKDFFSKFWKNELPMDKSEKSLMTLKTMTLQGQQLEDPVIEETTSFDGGWEETNVKETKYITERELNRAKKVDLQDALGIAETVDGGSHETRVVETRITSEMERPVHRSRMIQIQDALGRGDEQTTQDSSWEDTRVVETQIQGERALNRSRQVDITTALGGAGGTSDSGFTETTTTETRYGVVGSSGIGSGGVGSAGVGSGGVGSGGAGSGGFGSGVTRSDGVGSEGSGSRVQRIYTSQLSNGSEVFEEGLFEEGVIDSNLEFRGSTASQSEIEGSDFGYATMTRTAETEQIQSAELEEKKTFIIRSVINPYDGNEISLQEAIVEGFIRPTQGSYVNPRTGETIPIPQAMSKGLIIVAFTSTKRGQEKRSSMGIITVKTVREPLRPYIVNTVTDPRTGEKISQREAAKREILHEQRGIYVNKKTNERMLVSEAIEKGLMDVEYTGDAPEPEVISKTYAVRAVVDLRLKKVITFTQAVQRGIIDKESGAYTNTMTGETMYVGDAIMRGFLKARKIDRTASLDIDPQNKMLVDKTETIRKKVLQPLKVISAFKRAAKFANVKQDTNNN